MFHTSDFCLKKEKNDISNIHSKFQDHTSKNCFNKAIWNTSFNFHAFSIDGWVVTTPPPFPVTSTANPTPVGGTTPLVRRGLRLYCFFYKFIIWFGSNLYTGKCVSEKHDGNERQGATGLQALPRTNGNGTDYFKLSFCFSALEVWNTNITMTSEGKLMCTFFYIYITITLMFVIHLTCMIQ